VQIAGRRGREAGDEGHGRAYTEPHRLGSRPLSRPHPTEAEIVAWRAELGARDPGLARVDALVGPIAWRSEPGGFEGLVSMIVGQQVSTASARAIWARVAAGLGEITPGAAVAAGQAGLLTMGLSRPKARYIFGIAEAFLEHRHGVDHLETLDDAEALAALTSLVGIGRWSAEVFLMFCEGRTDLFPVGDIALQEALRWLDGLEVRPTEKQAEARAAQWSPHRSTAAHLLWAWYGAVRRGALPRPA
jgi:DNA-3-methyladenine glycosylase II